MNLYGFVENDGVNGVDVFGLYTYLLVWAEEAGVPFREAAEGMAKRLKESEFFDDKCDEVVVAGVDNVSEFNALLKEHKEIAQVRIFAHSGDPLIFFSMSRQTHDANLHGTKRTDTIGPPWNRYTFKATPVSDLDNSNTNPPIDHSRTADEPARLLFVYGCNSSTIARELGSHLGLAGYGTSGTCYFPRVSGVPKPMPKAQYALWKLINGMAKLHPPIIAGQNGTILN